MSRSRTCARRRRARMDEFLAEFARKRDDPEAFGQLLERVSASDTNLWRLARIAAGDKPLDEIEEAMIADAVAPHLARMKPGIVRRQRELANLVKRKKPG